MSAERWSYLSPDPAPKYAKEVQQATTLNDLLDVLQSWSDIAPDALACAAGMQLTDFLNFRSGLMKERRKQYAGDEWAARFTPILLPERMFTASMLAESMKVPWGLAFIRCKEIGWKKVLSRRKESP